MALLQVENSITREEQTQIYTQIEEDLLENLYKYNKTAILADLLVSLSIFLFYFQAVSFIPLLIWFILFNITLAFKTIITIQYRKYPYLYVMKVWKRLLSGSMIISALLWGTLPFLETNELFYHYISFAALSIVAGVYSISTVGQPILSYITLTAILWPIILGGFYQGIFYYYIGFAFVMVYYFFLLGMNRRSTDWLISSLRLKIENSYYTHQANHDLLTDLPNQRMLIRYIDAAIKNSKDENKNFAIVCFSINRIEMFNNSLGYSAGDLIIQSIAQRLKTAYQSNQIKINRIISLPRSDAFTIIIDPMTTQDIGSEMEILFEALLVPFHLGKREARLTASIGVSFYPTDGINSRILLSNAYAAMFLAKQHGGNAVEYYKREINEKAPWMLELESEMHHALINHEFEVYYQPIIDIIENKVAGMEALIRWNHPKRGMVPPNDFIPLAAETGLILPIGEWVMEQSCKQTVEWLKSGLVLEELKVSVNLSVKQLRQGNLLAIVENILEKTGLNAHNLDLELTETEMLDEKLAPLIKDLTSRGVSLSIDDFGTGYSGLSYLKFFKVDKIKIDQSFIKDVTSNVDSSTIVSAILAMGKEMGIKTLAEGVETVEQLNFLKERSCRYVQGYYFSKPVPAVVFAEFLKNFNAAGNADDNAAGKLG